MKTLLNGYLACNENGKRLIEETNVFLERTFYMWNEVEQYPLQQIAQIILDCLQAEHCERRLLYAQKLRKSLK